jgi:dolichol-phosphate mannosyltransferase
MKATVVVPAYNESATIRACLERVLSSDPGVELEVVVVDDGSSDGTAEAAALPDPRLRVLRHPRNMGKGAAVRTGLAAATGELLLIQDADLEYDPAQYRRLLEPLAAGACDVVYGSRILEPSNVRSYWRYYWGGRFLSWWTNLLYGSAVTDEPTGYKAFRTSLLRSLDLRCDGFEFCPEVTAKLLRRGVEIREVPISYRPRSIGEGKKIRWQDGVVALWTLLRHRF